MPATERRNFVLVIDKAREACRKSGHAIADHFGDITKMVEIGSNARREIADIRLSCYACYLKEARLRALRINLRTATCKTVAYHITLTPIFY